MTSPERLICPPEVVKQINQGGGFNRYGAPNFRLVWGQTETFRAGGTWSIPAFTGYRDLLCGFGEAAWILQEWQPPEAYGTPLSYYFENLDMHTGLQILGEFPYQGRYETVFKLVELKVVNGKLKTIPFPLNPSVLRVAIHTIQLCKEVSMLRRKEFFEERQAMSHKRERDQIEDALLNATPNLGEIRSARALPCRSAIQDRCEAIEKSWRNALPLVRYKNKGITML